VTVALVTIVVFALAAIASTVVVAGRDGYRRLATLSR